jgi:hypothetical protein
VIRWRRGWRERFLSVGVVVLVGGTWERLDESFLDLVERETGYSLSPSGWWFGWCESCGLCCGQMLVRKEFRGKAVSWPASRYA